MSNLSEVLFKVEKPGLYATIQDLGRFGYQQYGVPISGAIDRYAHRMVNYILGNNKNFATIEVTFFGTELLALKNHTIAIAGADLTALIDNEKAPLWEAFEIRKGQRIMFKKPNKAVRAYIGVAGGISSESILGSCSTYERGKMNRRLDKGDIIFAKSNNASNIGLKLSSEWIPEYEDHIELRVLPCHNELYFTEESIKLFYEQTYTFETGDRMGCMIAGEQPLEHRKQADIVSESATFGTIQIPPTGQPIILLADSQTTGGYATIGTVITVDLWKIAQLPLRGTINFKRVNLEEAQYLLKNWYKRLV